MISPAKIDSVLRALPGVADAAAFGIPHPRRGEEFVAAIVRAPSSALPAGNVTGQGGVLRRAFMRAMKLSLRGQ